MEYKGFKYTVVQTANPTGWKWTVWLDERRSKMGNAFSRASAITFAQHAIEKILKKSGRTASMLNNSNARSRAG
jgi:hypothetical protein